MTRLLAATDLAGLLHVEAVLEAVEVAFAAYTAGKTRTPLRVGVETAVGVLLAMPCAIEEPEALGTKVVSIFRGNKVRGLPTLTSLYLLSDAGTGAPLAVMDGTYLTAIRTAAGSAVATKYLARPDAQTLGVFGTGVQARYHVETIRRVRPIRRVLAVGTSPESAERFAAWVRETTGLDAAPSTPTEASGADVLAVCTTSSTPVVDDASVWPGTHVNAVGAFTPTTRELPGALVGRARVFADTRAGVLAEAGDVRLAVDEGLMSLDRLAGELGQVVLGQVAGRTSAQEITVYKSVGAAFLDAATARLAFERAASAGVGSDFDFGHVG